MGGPPSQWQEKKEWQVISPNGISGLCRYQRGKGKRESDIQDTSSDIYILSFPSPFSFGSKQSWNICVLATNGQRRRPFQSGLFHLAPKPPLDPSASWVGGDSFASGACIDTGNGNQRKRGRRFRVKWKHHHLFERETKVCSPKKTLSHYPAYYFSSAILKGFFPPMTISSKKWVISSSSVNIAFPPSSSLLAPRGFLQR